MLKARAADRQGGLGSARLALAGRPGVVDPADASIGHPLGDDLDLIDQAMEVEETLGLPILSGAAALGIVFES